MYWFSELFFSSHGLYAKRFQLTWGEMVETQDSGSLAQLDSPVRPGWPQCHITYPSPKITRGRHVSEPHEYCCQDRGIQTASLNRPALISPLLLSLLSTLSYLSTWQDPRGWSKPFSLHSPKPGSFSVWPPPVNALTTPSRISHAPLMASLAATSLWAVCRCWARVTHLQFTAIINFDVIAIFQQPWIFDIDL